MDELQGKTARSKLPHTNHMIMCNPLQVTFYIKGWKPSIPLDAKRMC